MRRFFPRAGAVFAVLATAFALQAAAAPAAHAAESCSAPAVFGSYALRACVIVSVEGHVLGFAHVSLKAGHSDCVIRGRLGRINDGWVSDPAFAHPCPRNIETSFKTPPMPYPAIGYYVGTYYSAFSIVRVGDGHVGPQMTSPTLTALAP